MKPVDVSLAPRRVVMPEAAEVEDNLPGGLELVKRIYERTLRAIDTKMKGRMDDVVSGNEIKIVQCIASSLVDIEKAKRDRERHDRFGDALEGMGEAELWKIINSKK